jgi:hypothetical protein
MVLNPIVNELFLSGFPKCGTNTPLLLHYPLLPCLLCNQPYILLFIVLQGENICLQKFHFEHVLGMIISPEQSYLCTYFLLLVTIWCTFFRLLGTVFGSNLVFGVNLVNLF